MLDVVCNDNPARVHLKINFTLLRTVCGSCRAMCCVFSLIFIFAKICSRCTTHSLLPFTGSNNKNETNFVFAIILYNLRQQHYIAILLNYFISPRTCGRKMCQDVIWGRECGGSCNSGSTSHGLLEHIKVKSHFAKTTTSKKKMSFLAYRGWIERRN